MLRIWQTEIRANQSRQANEWNAPRPRKKDNLVTIRILNRTLERTKSPFAKIWSTHNQVRNRSSLEGPENKKFGKGRKKADDGEGGKNCFEWIGSLVARKI